MDLQVHRFSSIDSTNAYCKRNAESLGDFCFVWALEQTAGKGREQREWVSPKGENLLFSILIKGQDLLKKKEKLSLFAAMGVASFLRDELALEGVAVKWPNDVYIKGKKAAGILLEGQLPSYLVIGIGLNVNQASFKGQYRVVPTSVFIETGKQVDLASLSEKLFLFLHDFLSKKEEARILEDYPSFDYLKDKRISLFENGSEIKGIAQGIDGDFSLLLQTKAGLKSIHSGEVITLLG